MAQGIDNTRKDRFIQFRKWSKISYLCLIILISCSDNSDEDMKLFVSSLSNSGGVVPVTEYNLINDSFSSVSADWTNNGFTVNSGLEASGTGSMAFNIEYNSESYLDRQTAKIEVVVNDVTSKFAVAKNTAFRGNLATVDLNTNTLYLGVLQTSGVEPTYEFSTPITITKTIGDTYVLELTKDRNIMRAKFYNSVDSTTYNQIEKDYGTDTTYHGDCWGNPTAIFFSGNIKITNFKYQSLVNFTPKIQIFGDSYIEGVTLIGLGNSKESRYADLLYVQNGGDMILSGFGGENSTQLLSYIDFEQTHIAPTYTILAVGLNDSVYATWKANIDSAIAKVLANGSTPVLCTFPPRADRQAFLNQANDYILNTLAYDVIDVAAAVTTSGDRLNWVASYLLPDGVHPTVAGHQAIYDWIVINNNYLT